MVEWFLALPWIGKASVVYCVFLFACLCLLALLIWKAPLLDEDAYYAKNDAGSNDATPKRATSAPRGASISSTKRTPESAVLRSS